MPIPAAGDLATSNFVDTLINNTDELLVSMVALAAGTYVYGPFYNPKAALRVAIGVAAIGGGSITVSLLGYDNSSGLTWTAIASSALAGTGLARIEVGPWVAASANAIAQDYAPTYYELQVVIATGPVSGTIGVHGLAA